MPVVREAWGVDKPLRKDEERRAAQVEIDAIVALLLGVTADELCMIYRTQFPVMRRYDQEDRFNANGRKAPKEIVKADAKLKDGAELSVADRTWVHPQSGVEYVYEYPFRILWTYEPRKEGLVADVPREDSKEMFVISDGVPVAGFSTHDFKWF